MLKNVFWLQDFYKLVSNQLLGLVYDTDDLAAGMKLIIDKRRINFIEAINPKSCYILLAEQGLDKILKYEAIELENFENTYQLNIPDILSKFSISFEQLNSSEYQKIKRRKKIISRLDIYPVGIISEERFWLDMNVYHLSGRFFPDKLKIGKTDMLNFFVESLYSKSDLYDYFLTMKDGRVLDIEQVKHMVTLMKNAFGRYSLSWEHGMVECDYNMCYGSNIPTLTFYHPDDASKNISIHIPIENEERATQIIYVFTQCKDYFSARNTYNKMVVLGYFS